MSAWWTVWRRAGKRKLLRSGKQLRPPACHQGLKLRLESVGVGIFMVGSDEGCDQQHIVGYGMVHCPQVGKVPLAAVPSILPD